MPCQPVNLFPPTALLHICKMNVANAIFFSVLFAGTHMYVCIYFYGLLTNYANFPLVRGYEGGRVELDCC